MTSVYLIALWNHLWQSTLFLLAAGAVTYLLHNNSARARCSVWLVASAKFLAPFALLTAVGAHIPWPLGPIYGAEPAFLSIAGQKVSQFMQLGVPAAAPPPVAHAVNYGDDILIISGLVWALGALVVTTRWYARWRIVRRALRESEEANLAFAIPVRSSSAQIEPAVVGIFRPVLLLPKGIEHRLTPQEMRAALAHEYCHVASRDNLAATLHMLVEALFWFHPLVWWLGARIVEERERACDEQVLADGHSPGAYAEGLLKVCDHYLESRLACVAGIGGANLSRRIEAIMKNRRIERLSGMRKLVIVVMTGATIVAPVAVGVLTSPYVRAEASRSDAGEPAYRNVSIRLIHVDPRNTVSLGGGSRGPFLQYYSLRALIADAYGVSEPQVVGRHWSTEPGYDISADAGTTLESEHQAMMRHLLEKHFGLVVRLERRQMDGYVLVIGPGGSKLKPNASDVASRSSFLLSRNSVVAANFPFSTLVQSLQNAVLRAPVVDQTGLQGRFNYNISWGPWLPDTPADPVAVTKALEEQLGLRLEAKPVTVDVINVVSLKSPENVVTPTSGRVTFSFQDADILEVAAAVQMATHKTFVIDPRVQAKVTMSSPTPISPDEFFEQFKALLKQHGFIAVPEPGQDAIKILLDKNGTHSAPAADSAISVLGQAGAATPWHVGLPLAWKGQDGLFSLDKESKLRFTADTVTEVKPGTLLLEGHVRIIGQEATVESERAIITHNPDGGIKESL